MAVRSNSSHSPPLDRQDYAAWMRRVLKLAQDGGPNVASARAMAAKYGSLDDTDLQTEAAIRDTKRGMFATSELKRAATLLVQEAILDEEAGNGIALARWLVHARLATAIALIYGHDPEQDWVQAAILVSIDSTPVQAELDQEQKEQGHTIWDGAFQVFGVLLLDLIMTKIGARLKSKVGSKSVQLVLLSGIRKILRAAGEMGPVRVFATVRDSRKCRRVGKTAQRIFRFRGLPSTTEKALAQ